MFTNFFLIALFLSLVIGFCQFSMQKFNLIFDDLRVVVAHAIQHMSPFLEYEGVRRVAYLKELVLLLHKHAIVDEGPPGQEVQEVG